MGFATCDQEGFDPDPSLVQTLPLPQPFRRIDKILQGIISRAVDIADEIVEARKADARRDAVDAAIPAAQPPIDEMLLSPRDIVQETPKDVDATLPGDTRVRCLAVCQCGNHTASLLRCGAVCVTGVPGAPDTNDSIVLQALVDASLSVLPSNYQMNQNQEGEAGGKSGRGNATPRGAASSKSKSKPSARSNAGEKGGRGQGADEADADASNVTERDWLAGWVVPRGEANREAADNDNNNDSNDNNDRVGKEEEEEKEEEKGQVWISCHPGRAGGAAVHVAVCSGGEQSQGIVHLGVIAPGEQESADDIGGIDDSSAAQAQRQRAQISWVSLTAPAAARLARPSGMDVPAGGGDADPQSKRSSGKKESTSGKKSGGGKGHTSDADVSTTPVHVPRPDPDAYYDYRAPVTPPGRATVVFAGPNDALVWWERSTTVALCTTDLAVSSAALDAAALERAKVMDAVSPLEDMFREEYLQSLPPMATAGGKGGRDGTSSSSSSGKSGSGSSKKGGGGSSSGAADGGDGSYSSAAAAAAAAASARRWGGITLQAHTAASAVASTATTFGIRCVWHLPEQPSASAVCPRGETAVVGGARGSLWVYDHRDAQLRAALIAIDNGPNRPAGAGRKHTQHGHQHNQHQRTGHRALCPHDPVVAVCMSSCRRAVTAHASGALGSHDLATGRSGWLKGIPVTRSTDSKSSGGGGDQRCDRSIARVALDTVAVVTRGWDVLVVAVGGAEECPVVTGRVVRPDTISSSSSSSSSAGKGKKKNGGTAADRDRNDPRRAPRGHIATTVTVEAGVLRVVDEGIVDLTAEEIAARRVARRVAREKEKTARIEAQAAAEAAAAAGSTGGKKKSSSSKKKGGGTNDESNANDTSANIATTNDDDDIPTSERAVRVSVSVDAESLALQFPRPDPRDTAAAAVAASSAAITTSSGGGAAAAQGSGSTGIHNKHNRHYSALSSSTSANATNVSFAFSTVPDAISAGQTRRPSARADRARAMEKEASELGARQRERERAEEELLRAERASRWRSEYPRGQPILTDLAAEFARECEENNEGWLGIAMQQRLDIRNMLRESTGALALDPSEEGSLSIARA